MQQMILEGFTLLPLFLEDAKTLKHAFVSAPPFLYFKQCKVLEEKFLKELKRLCLAKSAIGDFSALKAKVEKLFSLQEKQVEAVFSAIRAPLTLLAGGPGTGKTFTAAAFLYAFASLQEEKPLKVAALAPTGKAAKHLQDALKKTASSFSFITLDGFTLHKALYSLQNGGKFPYDLILVDECSMIDSSVFFRLLQGIKEGTKLILLGDPNQLPAVESGSFFADLLLLAKKSCFLNAHILEKTLRTENLQILELAKACLNSDEKTLSSHLYVDLIHEGEERKVLFNLVEEAKKKFSFLCTSSFDEELFSSLNNFLILSATRKSLLGVESVNRWVKLSLTEGVQNYFLPIIVNENDSITGLCNGEILLLQIKDGVALKAYSLASSGIETYPPALLPPYELAFCLSVHKAQGSEYKEVVALFPSHAERFGKELLYTAVTRAKQNLRLIAHKEALFSSLQKTTLRYSGIVNEDFTSANL